MGTPQNALCPTTGDCFDPVCALTMVGNTTVGTCGFTNTTAGTPCGVDDECEKQKQCDGLGACAPTVNVTAADCDEGDPCATYSCDPEKGCVKEYITLNGTACGATYEISNSTCFLNSTCNGLGGCLPDPGASTVDCDDGIDCTDDICDGTGTCIHVPNRQYCPSDPGPCSEYYCDANVTAPSSGCRLQNATDGVECSDGYACTADDVCAGGICVGTADHTACPDISDCNVGICAPAHGASNALGCIPGFVFAPANYTGNACNSTDLCSENGVCDGMGDCVGTPISCEDWNDCTTDTCSPGVGCQYAAVTPGTACNTAVGDLCFLDAVCNNNATCEPDFGAATTPCDDSIDCTVDTCDSVNGCVFTEDDSFCASIPTGNPCTVFQCDGGAGAGTGCVETNRTATTPCVEDGGECSINGQCDGGGLCLAVGSDALCPSPAGFPCVEGVCTTVTGVNGTESTCDVANVTLGIACLSVNETECSRDYECDGAGECVAQTTITNATCEAVNAFNPCVLSFCDDDLGCVYQNLPFGTTCGFNNETIDVCFLDSLCDGIGNCVPDIYGAQQNCSDGIDCTVDGCDSVNNCTHTPDVSSCSPPLTNQCHEYICDGANDCVVANKTDGTHCVGYVDDECSTGFTCQGGVCEGTLRDELCPDADLCNVGRCVTANIGVDNYGLCATQPAANGTFCGPGDMCNLDMQCDGAGNCAAAIVISDADCLADVSSLTALDCAIVECVPNYGCVTCPANQNQTCSDPPFIESICFEQTICNDYAQCVYNINNVTLDCDDGLTCTEDRCDSVLGCVNTPRNDLCAQPQFGCYEAVCRPGAAIDATGCVLEVLEDNAPCDDKVDCTDNDICVSGVCVGVPQHEQCNDDLTNECLIGACIPPDRTSNFQYYYANWDPSDPLVFDLNDTRTSGCDFQKAPNGTICFANVTECEKAAFCQDGECTPTDFLTADDCTDFNDCTVDTCEPRIGCVHNSTGTENDVCSAVNGTDHQCFTDSRCKLGNCVPNIDGPVIDCTPTHTCLDSTCDSVYGCTFVANDTKCPDTELLPCEEWVCRPNSSPYAHGCVRQNKEAGTPCETGRACVVDGFCQGDNPLCHGTPLHDMCERDELECSVDTCVADPADLDVDELGCRQTLLEGPCRPDDPCITGDDVETFCDPETFFCLGGAPVVCPRQGEHSVPICIGGRCFVEFVDVADDDEDMAFHFDDWYLDFALWLTMWSILALATLAGFIMLMRQINSIRTGETRINGSGRSGRRSSGGASIRTSSSSSSSSSSSRKKRRKAKYDAGDYQSLL